VKRPSRARITSSNADESLFFIQPSPFGIKGA
jgi:hypothetical protein